MNFLKKIKAKIRRRCVLRGKHLKRFGLMGTKLISDGSDVFEYCDTGCYGNNNVIELQGRVRLGNSSIIINGNNNRIVIGANSYISNATFWVEGDGNEIKIGKRAFVNERNNFTCTEGGRLSIGDDCLFASDINFQVGDGHPIYNAEGERVNGVKDIIIGNHVWIGKRATILKGAEIPDGCIIGTGAIVTCACSEKNSVLVGVPAKVVKRNVRWGKYKDR